MIQNNQDDEKGSEWLKNNHTERKTYNLTQLISIKLKLILSTKTKKLRLNFFVTKYLGAKTDNIIIIIILKKLCTPLKFHEPVPVFCMRMVPEPRVTQFE